jgi:predicted Rossmann fold nucleotide-binding protein DprA/Smf involved in DNA uptake
MSGGSIGFASSAVKMSAHAPSARCSIMAEHGRRSRRCRCWGDAAAPPHRKICSREAAEREIEACGKFGVALVAVGEANYPRRLQMVDDAPPLLAIRGNAGVLSLPLVAIVGSRNASAAGVKNHRTVHHSRLRAAKAI